ncbi:MAG TPA: asparagine synthase-related protein [Gemmataceae bacterium]|nr:asparagine synthase-related protein [Gemmataceae bacterium]
MESSYLGGILERGPVERRPAVGAGAIDEDWGWMGEDAELFLHAAGSCCRLFTWDALALLIRGYARPSSGQEPLDLERVAEEIRCHYLEHGQLAVEWLDGSFTLALLDGQARRVLLYRNLVGSGFTYYHADGDGLLFGSNLADLVDAAHVAPQANRDALPAFFLYRCVPGRETLFDGFFRLLPGEQVCWDARGLTREQRQTFADLRGPTISDGEAVDLLDETMEHVLLDCARLRPGTANLLSGGVDSSYLQAVWGRVTPGDGLPLSFSIDVDHPHTWGDTDYAMTASRALGSRHTLVPADDPYAAYLLDALTSTGEPPNHVQSAYFGHLARQMVERGVTSGLCGEGADSLFGLGLANQLHNARVLRRLVPSAWLRRSGAWLSDLFRWTNLAATFRRAGHFNDFSCLQHPVNRVAAFADWAAVEACFGARAVADAAAERRSLLDRYAVPDCPQERLHAAGFLGEAMDSASLWTTLFNRAGADLLCPFLDSRIVRLALNLAPEVRFRFRRPKDTLKRALARLAPLELATRSKLGFGQPIFEWLREGGSLRPLVERISAHAFVDGEVLARVRQRPTWFLYSLLVYDLWHKLFIERSLPQNESRKHENSTTRKEIPARH